MRGESLAFRVSGEFRESDTYVKIHNTPYADPRRSRSEMVRAKLLLAPEDVPLRSLLTLSYTDSYAPQATLVGRPFDALDYGETARSSESVQLVSEIATCARV